jgi:hypothetical protein
MRYPVFFPILPQSRYYFYNFPSFSSKTPLCNAFATPLQPVCNAFSLLSTLATLHICAMKSPKPYNITRAYRLLIIVVVIVFALLLWQLWLVEKRMQALDDQVEQQGGLRIKN